MSIWYIRILSVSNTGQITNYKIRNIFKDYDEMFNWFAYDKSSKNIYTNGTYRYDTIVANQNLTGLDKYLSTYVNYYIFHLRNTMLYDVSNNIIIDIRKYKTEIISHIHTAQQFTNYEISHKKKPKHYRTHISYYGYRTKHSCLDKSARVNRTLSQKDIENEYNIPIKLYRGNKDVLRNYRKKVENNWKQKKVRKQWQYHQDISCKSHYKNLSNYCDDSWEME